jgi:hypothetical protein
MTLRHYKKYCPEPYCIDGDWNSDAKKGAWVNEWSLPN